MMITKYTVGVLSALAFLPSVGTLWETNRPNVTNVDIAPIYLDNNTYRVSLSGDVRKGCIVQSGDARMIKAPGNGRDLGQWEFDLSSGQQVVVLKVRLSCRQHTETLGPWPVTGKGNTQ